MPYSSSPWDILHEKGKREMLQDYLSLLVVSFVHKLRERHVAYNPLLRVLVHFRAVL